MSDIPAVIGVDNRGDFFYIARVHDNSGRPEIRALARFDRANLGEHHLVQDGQVRFSVADNRAISKNLLLPNPGKHDPLLLAQFELSQTLIEDEQVFLYSAYETAQPDRWLATAIRGELLDQLTGLLPPRDNGNRGTVRSRGVALALGYLHFCKQTSGDFVCLVDVGREIISVALIYKGRPAQVAHLAAGRFDLDDAGGIGRMATELKMLVGLKLSALSENGISRPLSGLVLSGDCLSEPIRAAITELFRVEVAWPSISGGFFRNPGQAEKIPLEKYLVALGLTVPE
ncbi:MAG TPA: hypothetical protein PLF13_00550 [candidate division Zixibacteria bacterium]|nr:hypothetical protein [candidate division Zixibacteria bacterium]